MRVSLNWLKDYVDLTRPAGEIAHLLTMAGVEVAQVNEIGANWAHIYVGRISKLERHPNADRLLLATVDYGREPVIVVTGAPNLAVGVHVPLALAGAVLVDPYSDQPHKMTLKPTKLRGILSEGMVCSAKELGLGDDHEGILILDPDSEIGRDLRDELGDTIFVLEVTPNRGDCLSMLGVAYEIAAHLDSKAQAPAVEWAGVGRPASELVSIEIADPDLCYRYCGTVIRGVKVGPSPRWLRKRLTAAGLRPINSVVDVTNYVMWELGQPLHAFDFDTLRGGKIVVRRANAGERMVTIDHEERELDSDTLVIADNERPVALAGVMGGVDTEVSESTVNVLIESATFNQTSIRKTVRKQKLPSEASRRFEKGLPLELARIAVDRATRLMVEVAGGQAAPGVVDVCPEPPKPHVIDFPVSEVRRLLGVELSKETIVSNLRRLSVGVEDRGDILTLKPPYWRRDIRHKADVCEEIARIIGYDRLPTRLLSGSIPEPQPNQFWQNSRLLRELLVGLGINEIVTYPLVSNARQSRVPQGTVLQLKDDVNEFDERFNPSVEPLKLLNPLSADADSLRVNTICQLLETLRDNLRYRDRDLDLFEIGRIYLPQDGKLPDERNVLSVVLYKNRSGRRWGQVEAQDFYDGKAVASAIAGRFGVVVSYDRLEHPLFLAGRSASVRDPNTGELLGAVGEIHPDVLGGFDINESAVLVVFDLDRLFQRAADRRRYRQLPRYPAIRQDLAVFVAQSTPAAQVEQVIREVGQPLLESVELFDVYQGERIGGHSWEGRSLAYHLTYRLADRTLTDEEVAGKHGEIIKTLEGRLQAQLRA